MMDANVENKLKNDEKSQDVGENELPLSLCVCECANNCMVYTWISFFSVYLLIILEFQNNSLIRLAYGSK